MALNFFMSNDLDTLFERLSNLINQKEELNLLKNTPIIVQNEGLIKWLSIKFAEKFGVMSGLNFFSPKSFIIHVLKEKNLLSDEDINFFNRISLLFNIFKVLKEENFNELENYFRDDDGKKIAQLSIALADIFDQYFIYRPDFFKNLKKIRSNWQREIFERVISKGFTHISEIIMSLEEINDLNHNVYLFGVSILPPIFISFFDKLSQKTDVNFFVINPSYDYWFDDLNELQQLFLSERSRLSQENLYLSDFNPILINNGRLIQSFFKVLLDNDFHYNEKTLYKEKEPITLLSKLQNSISNNTNQIEIIKDDSVQIHSFHNKWRELEGLYNYILDILNKNDDLFLEDIAVMCPNIDSYVPYIDGVFSVKGLKYNVADTISVNYDSGLKALFYILENLKDDISANEFLGILEFDAVREKFEIDSNTFQVIKDIIKELNLIWGMDKNSLKEFSYMSFLNTFEYCAKRVLFGFFDNTPGKLINNETLIYEKQLLSNSEITGKLLFLIDKIKYFNNNVKKAKTVNDFINIVREVSDTFIADEYASTSAFNYFFSEISNFYGEKTEITFPAFITFAKHIASISKNTGSFLKGGITFCEMVPLRSIPFKVICLLGMNDEDFPRVAPKYEFDEISKSPRLGDRDVKLSDRLLFLETILAAKKYLYISFIGRDLKRNKKQNPSIVVSELIDFLNLEIVEHPMHSHDSKYFVSNSDLRNYEKSDFIVASYMQKKEKVSKLVVSDKPLFNMDVDKSVKLDEIIRFFRNPIKFFFLKNGIYLDADFEELKDKEDVFLDNLKNYQINKQLFENKIYENVIRYSGVLPHGAIGDFYEKNFKENIEKLGCNLKKIECDRNFLRSKEILVKKDNITLEGNINFLNERDELVIIDFGKGKCDKKYFQIEVAIYLALLQKQECYYVLIDDLYKIFVSYPDDFLDKIFSLYLTGSSLPIYLSLQGNDAKLLSILKDKDEAKFKDEVRKNIKSYTFKSKDRYLEYFIDNFNFTNQYFDLLYQYNSQLKELKFECEKI